MMELVLCLVLAGRHRAVRKCSVVVQEAEPRAAVKQMGFG